MSGLTFNVKSTLKESGIKSDIESKIQQQQKYFDALVLQDSNYFIPIKTGTMEKSSQINTRLGTGEIVWRTPYARRQYYDYHKPPYQPNPNACGKWFEAAKARWLEKWVRFINERIKR
ncbi:MAG: minor capsid protein [Clostridia bacterium]|nr:minor capsid protein [Clostridia bacterium]